MRPDCVHRKFKKSLDCKETPSLFPDKTDTAKHHSQSTGFIHMNVCFGLGLIYLKFTLSEKLGNIPCSEVSD